MNKWAKAGIWTGGIFGLLLLLTIIFRVGWVKFVDNYEYGFIYNTFTGEIQHVERTGYIVRTPFKYAVHAIDIRPYQITISANKRVLNAKLCRFNPEGLKTFVEWHGRDAGDDRDNLLEILKCYAFDRDEGRDCPFLTVISVLAPSQGAMPTESKEKK